MRAWAGRRENVAVAQAAFYRRVKMNSLARYGKWSQEVERAA
jgi:fructose-bisphosphate aldolase class I